MDSSPPSLDYECIVTKPTEFEAETFELGFDAQVVRDFTAFRTGPGYYTNRQCLLEDVSGELSVRDNTRLLFASRHRLDTSQTSIRVQPENQLYINIRNAISRLVIRGSPACIVISKCCAENGIRIEPVPGDRRVGRMLLVYEGCFEDHSGYTPKEIVQNMLLLPSGYQIVPTERSSYFFIYGPNFGGGDMSCLSDISMHVFGIPEVANNHLQTSDSLKMMMISAWADRMDAYDNTTTTTTTQSSSSPTLSEEELEDVPLDESAASRSSSATLRDVQTDENSNLCIICETSISNVQLQPCKHSTYCAACIEGWRLHAPRFTCPICRSSIERIVPLVVEAPLADNEVFSYSSFFYDVITDRRPPRQEPPGWLLVMLIFILVIILCVMEYYVDFGTFGLLAVYRGL